MDRCNQSLPIDYHQMSGNKKEKFLLLLFVSYRNKTKHF